MKVKELIEKLKEFDPELTVCVSDSEYGNQAVDDVDIIEDAWVYWDKATVLQLSGNDLRKEDIDPKYFFPQERPEYKPSPIMDNLKLVYDSAMKPGTMFLMSKTPPPIDMKYITFPIHNHRTQSD